MTYDMICIGMALVDSIIKGLNPEPVSASGYGDEKKEEGWDDANMKNIKNLMDSFKLTAKQAMDALKIDVKDQVKYTRQL